MRKAFVLSVISFLTVISGSCMSRQSKSKEIQSGEAVRFSQAEDDDRSGRSNGFAIDLFKAVNRFENDPEANVFISPLSVNIALNMLANGAAGETRLEIMDALGQRGYTMEQVNEYSRGLRDVLLAADTAVVISLANSLWYRQEIDVRSDFKRVLAEYYNADINPADFNSLQTVSLINEWCSANTNGRINSIIDRISPDDIMYLINAVYFKGGWAVRFDENDTRDAVFHAPAGDRDVKMMRASHRFGYARSGDCSYVELPYGNRSYTMVVALPDEGIGIDEVIGSLDGSEWGRIVSELREVEVNLSIPRFKFEGTYELSREVLPGMGIRRAFDSRADFGGISGDPRLFVSSVIHKTFVEVNEEGTEAAAVTSVGIRTTSVGPQPVRIVVDRPFLFFIRERDTGTVLFIGKMNSIP